MEEDLMTAGDAARIVGLTPAGVRWAAKDGRLQVARTTPGGVRLFDRVEVERFRRERETRRLGLARSGETA